MGRGAPQTLPPLPGTKHRQRRTLTPLSTPEQPRRRPPEGPAKAGLLTPQVTPPATKLPAVQLPTTRPTHRPKHQLLTRPTRLTGTPTATRGMGTSLQPATKVRPLRPPGRATTPQVPQRIRQPHASPPPTTVGAYAPTTVPTLTTTADPHRRTLHQTPTQKPLRQSTTTRRRRTQTTVPRLKTGHRTPTPVATPTTGTTQQHRE